MITWRGVLMRKTDMAVAWAAGWGVAFPVTAGFIGCLHFDGDVILFAGTADADAVTLQALRPAAHWTGSITREGDSRRITMRCHDTMHFAGLGAWSAAEQRYEFNAVHYHRPASARVAARAHG